MSRTFKTVLIWFVLIGVVVFGLIYQNRKNDGPIPTIPMERAYQLIDQGKVLSYHAHQRGLRLLTNTDREFDVPMTAELVERLQKSQVPYVSLQEMDEGNNLMNAAISVVGIFVVVIAVIYFLRKMGGGQLNKVLDLRQTKARPVEEANQARFTDIGGNSEAVEMLMDIVDFLKEPQRWKAAQARLPRGVLMVGPPGTGKTLLARAVAGETKSAFFYTSATEFVDMFVGVGASRVRDMFEKAAKQQPAVIFIDELDAIGRRRGSGVGTIHEEREQTLNQLLVALDGLERYDRLVVIAATNRLDVLDAALLRSGRFDRVLRLEAPNANERTEILKIHTRSKPLAPSIVLEQIARSTEGFTGADLETLTNEAALTAVRRYRVDGKERRGEENGSITLTMEDFEQSLKSLMKSNRQFDRLDSIIVESVSQFAEPTGRAVARIILSSGAIVEGDVVWMNSTHMKVRGDDGSEVIIAKATAQQIVRMDGTESTPQADFTPDLWAGRSPSAG